MTYSEFEKKFEDMADFSFADLAVFLEVDAAPSAKVFEALVSAVVNYSSLVPANEESAKKPLNTCRFPNTRNTWKELAKGLMCAISLDFAAKGGNNAQD